MKYNFPIPFSRDKFSAQSVQAQISNDIPTSNSEITGVILHALVVRIAYADGHTEEFYPKLQSDTLEIDIPQDRLNQLSNVTIGPKIQQFVEWFTQKITTVPAVSTITSSGTLVVTCTSDILLVDASDDDIELMLPSASSLSISTMHIKKIDSSPNTVYIYPPSGTIDGESQIEINVQNESYQLTSDGENYFII